MAVYARALYMITLHILLLTAPLLTIPIFVINAAPNWLLRIGLSCAAMTLLGMVFGFYGRLVTAFLIFDLIPDVSNISTVIFADRLLALGLFSCWGTSYPMFILLSKMMTRFRSQNIFLNMLLVFIIFYGLHILFSGVGILIIWTYLKF